jgi:hypothetical protein
MSAAVDKIDYVPQYLSGLPGLFVPDPVRTEQIWIEERSTGAVILPFSPRGAAPHQTGGDRRAARSFRTLRYGDASRITASELLAIRAWNSEVALKDLQTEVARRQFKIKQNMALTKEFHLLNCVTEAKVKDADGTVMYDWANEFQQAIPAEMDFDLDNANPATRAIFKKCKAVRRSIQIGLKGVGIARDIIGLCGDAFWDDLTGSSEVEKSYLNWTAAADLRNDVGGEWQTFRYGQILFVNYRSTDDGTTLGIDTNKCKFFPVGADIFRLAYSPGERFEHLGQLGQETYSAMVLDDKRNSWADVEVYSYPLPVCTMPQALYSAKRT